MISGERERIVKEFDRLHGGVHDRAMEGMGEEVTAAAPRDGEGK